MAKKKATEEGPKFKSIEEKLTKTNPLYMPICQNSKTCDQPSKTTDLGDMILETCSHCMARRSWVSKAELEKIEKAKLKEQEKLEKQAEKNTKKVTKTEEPKAEVKVEESLDIEISEDIAVSEPVNQEDDLQIKKSADDLKNAMSNIDSMISNSGLSKGEVKEALQGLDDDYHPFEDVAVEQEIQEGDFLIVEFKPVSEEEVDLICNTLNGKNRFKVRVTTDPKKIKVIVDNPTKVIGKKAKVEYKGLNEKGLPIEPNYLGFAK